MTYKTSVVELDCGRILKDVSPPEVGAIGCLGVCSGEELVAGRCQSAAHQREFVIHQTGVESSNESTCMTV